MSLLLWSQHFRFTFQTRTDGSKLRPSRGVNDVKTFCSIEQRGQWCKTFRCIEQTCKWWLNSDGGWWVFEAFAFLIICTQAVWQGLKILLNQLIINSKSFISIACTQTSKSQLLSCLWGLVWWLPLGIFVKMQHINSTKHSSAQKNSKYFKKIQKLCKRFRKVYQISDRNE